MSTTAGADWTTAWTAALDDLELTLVQTEQLLNGGQEAAPTPPPWTPPELGAPLPSEMLDRARSLLARQHQLIDRTAGAISGNRQSSALISKVADVSGPRRSAHAVYLDVRA